MENTSGLSPLQATQPENNCIEDFATLFALYEDIARHMFFSPAAAQSVKGDTGDDGPQGEDGIQGSVGPKGEVGEDGDDAYEVWLRSQSDQDLTEVDFINDITGPEGPAPTSSQISKIPLSSGATFGDIRGDLLSIYHIEYADPAVEPISMVPPSASAISSKVDLLNGYVRVFFTVATGDANYKLVSSGFEEPA